MRKRRGRELRTPGEGKISEDLKEARGGPRKPRRKGEQRSEKRIYRAYRPGVLVALKRESSNVVRTEKKKRRPGGKRD